MKVKIYELEGREPERWVILDKDERIKPKYMISNYGRIKNEKGKILNGDVDKDGYIRYTLQGHEKKIRVSAHRMVALHYLKKKKNKTEINHKRVVNNVCIHDDNYFENLEWVNHKENIKHSRKNNLQTIYTCESSSRAKVDNDTVHLICLLLESGYTNKEIRKKMNIPKEQDEYYRGLIKHIKSHKHWKEISSLYNF